MGRVRLKDVAARAKVDPSTASRVLSGRSDLVKDETARRVLEASRALGYTPNAFARGLRTQRTGSIGVVLPEFSNPVYAAVIDGIEQRAAELGLSVVSTRCARPIPVTSPGWCLRTASTACSSRPLPTARLALDVLDATGVPYVLVNRAVAEASASVVLDEESGVQAAVRLPGRRRAHAHRLRLGAAGHRHRPASQARVLQGHEGARLRGRPAARRRGVRAGDRPGRDASLLAVDPPPDSDLRLDDQGGAGRAAGPART